MNSWSLGCGGIPNATMLRALRCLSLSSEKWRWDLTIKMLGKIGFDACCLLKNYRLDFRTHFREWAFFRHPGFPVLTLVILSHWQFVRFQLFNDVSKSFKDAWTISWKAAWNGILSIISFFMLSIVAFTIFSTLGFWVLTDVDPYLRAGHLTQISTRREIFRDKQIFRFRHV